MTLSCWREYGVVDLCIRNKGFLYSSYKCFRLANDPAQVTMFVEVFCVTAELWEERRESRWDSSDTSSLHSQTSRHSPGENWNFAFNQWNVKNTLSKYGIKNIFHTHTSALFGWLARRLFYSEIQEVRRCILLNLLLATW